VKPPPFDDIGAVGRSGSATELSARLACSLRRLGFRTFEYHWFTWSTDGACLYSLGSRGSARTRRRLWLDPFVQHCRIAYTPVVWQALSPDASIRQVLTWSPWKGLPIRVHSGIAIPVHGPDRSFGLLTATVAAPRSRPIPPENVHTAHAMAIAVYEVVLTNRDNRRFGLTCDIAELDEITHQFREDDEKARVQPAAKH
jgi:hypothetical protein